jgi:hypothetical protein
MTRVVVVPTTTAVVREDLVALRGGAGSALIVATVLASTVFPLRDTVQSSHHGNGPPEGS